MLKIDFCLQCGEIPIFCMLCVCFVFVFVEQIGPDSRARTKRNVCASFVFVFVNTLGRPKALSALAYKTPFYYAHSNIYMYYVGSKKIKLRKIKI